MRIYQIVEFVKYICTKFVIYSIYQICKCAPKQRRIVDKHLPVEEVSVCDRPLTPWFDNDCRAAKRKVRMLERRYRRTHSAMDCMAWVRQLEHERDLLERKEERYWNEKIASNAGKPKKLWSLLNSL